MIMNSSRQFIGQMGLSDGIMTASAMYNHKEKQKTSCNSGIIMLESQRAMNCVTLRMTI